MRTEMRKKRKIASKEKGRTIDDKSHICMKLCTKVFFCCHKVNRG